jgi:hypothetical protein
MLGGRSFNKERIESCDFPALAAIPNPGVTATRKSNASRSSACQLPAKTGAAATYVESRAPIDGDIAALAFLVRFRGP